MWVARIEYWLLKAKAPLVLEGPIIAAVPYLQVSGVVGAFGEGGGGGGGADCNYTCMRRERASVGNEV